MTPPMKRIPPTEPNPTTFTRTQKRQRHNLAKLAVWLRDNERRIAKHFAMYCYFFAAETTGDAEQRPACATKHECGTTACLLGHGVMAGIPAKPRESWNAYASRAFGTHPGSSAWRWLFAAHHSDHIKAGLRRISWHLEGRELPNNPAYAETPVGYRCNWKLMEKLAA